MADVTRILSAIEQGDPQAAEQLLPLVYNELRKLAAKMMAREKPGQTVQATALVHEAYIRLVDVHKAQHWNSRGHFFVATAEAMRRILVANARRKRRLKRGGSLQRQEFDQESVAAPETCYDLLKLDAALTELEEQDPRRAQVVKLRYFGGLGIDAIAATLGVSSSTVDRDWTYARAWLFRTIEEAG